MKKNLLLLCLLYTSPEGTPILEVTMSSPESYYLRGFTGGSYTGTGWEDTDAGARWKNKNLFYWLHAGGFYGQECLGKAAVALDLSLIHI